MKTKLLTITLSLLFYLGYAQHNQNDNHHEFHPHHSLGLVIGHTQITQGVNENGKKEWISVPSWGINYNYKFSEKWAIGLHNDIIIEEFSVKDYNVDQHSSGADDSVIERSYPIASAVVASYKPGKHFSYLLGSGIEFAHSGNFFLLKIGAEYGYHISEKWELNALIINDLKLNEYNSWQIGLGITKVF